MEYIINKMFAFKKEIISFGLLFTAGLYVYRKKTLSLIQDKEELNKIDLTGKVVLITGGNDGIGFETALKLARHGAKLIIACRDLRKANRAAEKIRNKTGNLNIFVEWLDLASFDSVRLLAKNISSLERIDYLINNAGVMGCPREITKDGFEYQFQVNYLSHFLLTRLLLDKLAQSSSPRIINVTSKLYETGEVAWNDINLEYSYDPIVSYKQSKLCNILFTNELESYLREIKKYAHINAFAVSPGVVLTNLGRFITKNYVLKFLFIVFYPIAWYTMRTPKQGAECIVFCVLKNNLKPTSGFYLRDCQFLKLKPHANKKADAKRLWDISEKYVKEYS